MQHVQVVWFRIKFATEVLVEKAPAESGFSCNPHTEMIEQGVEVWDFRAKSGMETFMENT